MTEYHNYNTPSKGTDDWHIPLNENFRQIDQDIEIRDVKANLDDYTPKTNARYFSTDTNELYLGNGSKWLHQGRVPKTSGADSPALRVFGANSSGENVHYSDYVIENFTDIGEAIQKAHDDLIEANLTEGAVIRLPVGDRFDFSTPIEINIPLTLFGYSGSMARHTGTGSTPGAATKLNWVGGSKNVLTIRGSDQTGLKQDPDNLSGLRLEGFSLTNDGGSATNLLYLDGTSNTNPNGSVIRESTYRNLHLGGANEAEILAEGTVFIQHWDRLSVNTTNGVGMDVRNVSGSPAGGPSQWYFYTPYFYSNNAGWSADIRSQQVGIFGGTINEVNGGDGVRLGYRGSVIATNIEGQHNSGTTGCVIHGTGPWNFIPATVSRWETGLDIGDSTDPKPNADNVRFGFASTGNSSEDVLVTSGGHRRNWHPLVPNLSISDNRLSSDGISNKDALVLGNHSTTETISVDSTGERTFSININSQVVYDDFDISVVGTNDGQGGTVSDFALGLPIVQELDTSGGIDISVPVLSASASSGAEADVKLVFRRYE